MQHVQAGFPAIDIKGRNPLLVALPDNTADAIETRMCYEYPKIPGQGGSFLKKEESL